MAHWYLASWEWDTTGSPCWRAPAGAVAAIDLRSLTDQGTAGPTAAGWGFFGFDATQTLAGASYFGNDLSGVMSLAERNAWRNKLSIATALDNNRLGDVLAETLGQKATPGGNVRCKPVIPTTEGRIELWLGSAGKVFDRDFGGTGDVCWPNIQTVHQNDYRDVRARCLLFANAIEQCVQGDGSLAAKVCSLYAFRNGVSFGEAQTTIAAVYRAKYLRFLGGLVKKYARWSMARALFIPGDLTDEGELPPETTISDDFTLADGDVIGNTLTWTETNGDWDTVSNQASLTTTGGTASRSARAESDLSSDNHYAQVTVTNLATGAGTYVGGVAARFNSGALTFYTAHEFQTGGINDTARTQKQVTGTDTTIGSSTTGITWVATDVIKVECNGSSIARYRNGSLQDTATDSSITGNTRCGIAGFASAVGGGTKVDDFEAADVAAAFDAATFPYWTPEVYRTPRAKAVSYGLTGPTSS